MRQDDNEIMVTDNGTAIVYTNTSDGFQVYGEDKSITTQPIGKKGTFVYWGWDNRLPYTLMRQIAKDEVMSSNKLFNILTCYGAGIKYIDAETKEQTTNNEVKDFIRRNAFPRLFLEQSTDMKFFNFCIAVVILNREGTKIVSLRHKEACYCRFEKADNNGKINHVYFADFDNGNFADDEVETITLLDEYDPLTDLIDKVKVKRTAERKFAILCKFPTPGNRYYPIPYYASLFMGSWYDIKQLIALGKKTKIKNHAGIRYIVEIADQYWKELFKQERITDEKAKRDRIKEKKEEINKFLCGIENSGKTMFSGYYVDPNGNEVKMIRINVVDTAKEGGDWAEDIQEASNMLCYADNIHPNLIGATPGKQSNNSGSDKRELFTLKQSLEIAYHDVMKTPHDVIIGYNNWNVEVSIPMITLTTLDTHKDAQQVTAE